SGGTGGGGSGGAPTGGAAPVREVPVYRVDTSCGADQVFPTPLFFIEIDDSDTVDAYYVEEDCGGDTTGAYQPVYEDETVSDGVEDDILDDAESDGCSGNATDSYVDSSGEPIDESDGCSGDTTSDSSVVETGDTSSESYGEADCGGDTTGDSGSSSSDSDCGGDTTTSDSGSSDTSCGGDSGDSSDSCSVSRPRRVRPRFSVLVMGLLGLVAPLRRLTRPKRKKR
ncbi:MAG: hypothetical protein KC731_37150, partial [Myxococcales bacterium]|nr:hypothetical protein [Myxococcales bacterium]